MRKRQAPLIILRITSVGVIFEIICGNFLQQSVKCNLKFISTDQLAEKHIWLSTKWSACRYHLFGRQQMFWYREKELSMIRQTFWKTYHKTSQVRMREEFPVNESMFHCHSLPQTTLSQATISAKMVAIFRFYLLFTLLIKVSLPFYELVKKEN